MQLSGIKAGNKLYINLIIYNVTNIWIETDNRKM
jgi:hypothetical protein